MPFGLGTLCCLGDIQEWCFEILLSTKYEILLSHLKSNVCLNFCFQIIGDSYLPEMM